jgi:hypothetical protein
MSLRYGWWDRFRYPIELAPTDTIILASFCKAPTELYFADATRYI